MIGDKVAKRIRLERDLETVEREWTRTMKLAREGMIEDAELAKELPPLRERRKAIEAELAVQPEPEKTVSFLPAAQLRFERAMRDLHDAFRTGGVAGVAESADFLREIISTATLFRKEDGTGVEVEVKGHLNGLLTTRPADERRNRFVSGSDGSGRALPPFPPLVELPVPASLLRLAKRADLNYLSWAANAWLAKGRASSPIGRRTIENRNRAIRSDRLPS